MPACVPTLARKGADKSTLEFDWLLGDRQWFTLKAAAALTGMSDSFLEKLLDAEEHKAHLGAHEYNAGRGIKNTKRIPRAFIVRLLVSSATYDSEQKRTAVISLAREFNAADCRLIAAEFLRVAERK